MAPRSTRRYSTRRGSPSCPARWPGRGTPPMDKRPHRWARVIRAPGQFQLVPHDRLAALAAEATTAAKPTATAAKPTATAAKPTATAKPTAPVQAGQVIDRARKYIDKMPVA